MCLALILPRVCQATEKLERRARSPLVKERLTGYGLGREGMWAN